MAVLHGGSVRGNKLYESGLVTFGDLQAECPFPSACVVAKLDGGTLSACVQASRVAAVPRVVWHGVRTALVGSLGTLVVATHNLTASLLWSALEPEELALGVDAE